MKTRIFKDKYYGWRAESILRFGNVELSINTTRMLDSAILQTVARCAMLEERNGTKFVTYRMCEDYSERVAYSSPRRVTEKVVTEQHNAALSNIEDIKKRAAEHYTIKGEEETAKSILQMRGEDSN